MLKTPKTCFKSICMNRNQHMKKFGVGHFNHRKELFEHCRLLSSMLNAWKNTG